MDPNARPDPRYVAIHDQAAAELRPKAQVVASYWKALRDAGMPEYEAMELARDFQHWLLSGMGKNAGDPDDELDLDD